MQITRGSSVQLHSRLQLQLTNQDRCEPLTEKADILGGLLAKDIPPVKLLFTYYTDIFECPQMDSDEVFRCHWYIC